MEKIKQVWALAKAHPKIATAVVVVVIAIYFLANQEFKKMKKISKLYYDLEVRVKAHPVKYLVGLLILVVIAIAI